MHARPLRFLLVEDDDAHARLIRMAFEQLDAPVELSRVSDGPSALDFLRAGVAGTGEGATDVVLLDLRLPGMGGLDVLNAIKDDPALRLIPVVVLTCSDAPKDREHTMRRHASGYLTKPLHFDELLDLVRQLVRHWSCHQRAGVVRPAA
jgi:CheY-like chemotaxis protein